MSEYKKELLVSLVAIKKLAEDGHEDMEKLGGICSSITFVSEKRRMRRSDIDTMKMFFVSMCKQWPGYSGDATYPVPSGETIPGIFGPTETTPETAYHFRKCWDLESEYGKNRMWLLDWAIEELEKETMHHAN